MLTYPSTGNYPTGIPERNIDLATFAVDYNKFHHPEGKDMFKRLQEWDEWLDKLKASKMFLYSRRTLSPPGTELYAMDETGEIFYGLNFASADYLGLSQHPISKEASIRASEEYGVNSCGSPLALGGHKYYYQLIEEIKDFWQMKHVVLFSAGWMAGFGGVKCLVKANDHVVLDILAHNCLYEGARAATKNCYRVEHTNNQAMETKISELRGKYPDNGIFVITEGLFSMDADIPDLVGLQKICKKYEAFLLIDCAHDFGCMGPTGKGTFEQVGLTDLSNVVFVASGSKCLSTNVGWIACQSKAVAEYLKVHCTAYMFTNAVNPVQCATALSQLRILKSELGNQIRKKCIENYNFTRSRLEKLGYKIIGFPSPILIVFVGNEIISRLIARLMMDEGVHVNGIEYPVVGMGEARLRVNLMPQHTEANLEIFINTYDKVFKKATELFETAMTQYQKYLEKQQEAKL